MARTTRTSLPASLPAVRRGTHGARLAAAIAAARRRWGDHIIRVGAEIAAPSTRMGLPALSTGSLGLDLSTGGLPRGAVAEYVGVDGAGAETLPRAPGAPDPPKVPRSVAMTDHVTTVRALALLLTSDPDDPETWISLPKVGVLLHWCLLKADRRRRPPHAAIARLLVTDLAAHYQGAGYIGTHAGVRYLHSATLRAALPCLAL